MSPGQQPSASGQRWFWVLAFVMVALHVATRMGVFALWDTVATPQGIVRLPNTFASVDHPFHVARAEILWRELASSHVLRWVGQHQGGYPVEFYPLGEAWLEVVIRALSLATLPVEDAHTIAVTALFLLPGLAFAALAREDDWSPAVGLLALVLHVSLPGGWYSGGYTELVQWGLVTNVASAVAALLMLPLLVRYPRTCEGWAGALAGALAAYAVYCNPRSVLGLAAIGGGAWIAEVTSSRAAWKPATGRTALVALTALLLAAPELISLARFGGLYAFVHYSGYEGIADYARTSAAAVTLPVIVLAVAGAAMGLASRMRLATRSVSTALIIYVTMTAVMAMAPGAAALVSQSGADPAHAVAATLDDLPRRRRALGSHSLDSIQARDGETARRNGCRHWTSDSHFGVPDQANFRTADRSGVSNNPGCQSLPNCHVRAAGASRFRVRGARG